MPTNIYYQRVFNAAEGALVTARAIKNDFELIQAGFDLIQTSAWRILRKSANYTILPADNRSYIVHPNADTLDRTWTMQADATEAWIDGAEFAFINSPSAGVLTIASADLMRIEGYGSVTSFQIPPGMSARMFWDDTEATWVASFVSRLGLLRKSADYTVLPTDGGRTIVHPNSDTTARTWTLQANSTASWRDGESFTFVNNPSAGNLTITTSDTLRLEGQGTITSLVIPPGVSAKVYWDRTESAWTIAYKTEGLILQSSKSADYTLVMSDAGKHILHPSADTSARTWTIPANSSVPYRIGTAITFINQHGAGAISIAITSDTMRLAGAGTTGTRTLAADGAATAVKITATEWIIYGAGIT